MIHRHHHITSGDFSTLKCNCEPLITTILYTTCKNSMCVPISIAITLTYLSSQKNNQTKTAALLDEKCKLEVKLMKKLRKNTLI